MKRLLVGLVVTAVLVAMVAVPALAQVSKVFVTDVSPDGGSVNVSAASNVTATFNIRMTRSTINNKTFYLKQQGSSAVVPAQVTYRGTTKTATLNPDNDLAYGASYTAYVKGGRLGVKGANDQRLSGTTDATATFANARVSWTFSVAPPPPDTTIDSGPSSFANSRSASFSFSSSEPNSSFECSLDEASFSACSSGESYTVGADGRHTFSVRASDALGNFGTPASLTWWVDTVAPAAPSVSLDASSDTGSNNDNVTYDITPTISGTAEFGSTVKIYDAQDKQLASVPTFGGSWWHTFDALRPDGSYSYTIKATDWMGNESQGTSITLTIDTAAPETTIGDKPSSPANSASATFTFSSTEANSTFECSLDNARFATCSSPQSYSDLADGSHTFAVRATDAAGNFDFTPVRHTWTVETGAPTVTFTPANTADVAPNTNVRAIFSEAMNEASVKVEGTFTLKKHEEQGFFTPVEATVTYSSFSNSAFLDPSTDLDLNATYTATLTTEAKDLAGNALEQESSWTFTIANAPRSVTVAPTKLDFGTGCRFVTRTLTVTNNGPGDVTFAGVSLTGTGSGRGFQVDSEDRIWSSGPFTVPAGDDFTDEVMLIPSGRQTMRATLTYLDDTGATIGNPVTLIANTECIVVG
jgi:hypothetical protein